MVEVLEAARAFEDNTNVLFETSVVSAKDLYVLFNSVEAGRVCYGSDIPTATYPRPCTPSSALPKLPGCLRSSSLRSSRETSGGGSLERVGRGAGDDQPQG